MKASRGGLCVHLFRYWWAGIRLRRSTRAVARTAKKEGSIEPARAIGRMSARDRASEISRWSGIIMLGELADERDLEILIGALRDEDWRIGIEASKALANFDDADSLKALQETLLDETVDVRVRTAAAKAIRRRQ